MKLKRSFVAVGLLLVPVAIAVLWAFSANAGRGSTGRLDMYPLYGHAEDFSWVAGRIQTFDNPLGLCRGCGCTIIVYDDQNNSQVQLSGAGWQQFWRSQRWYTAEQAINSFLVVFGHQATNNDVPGYCIGNSSLATYVVDQVQVNPKP